MKTPRAELDERVVEQLLVLTATRIDFRREAIQASAIRKVAGTKLMEGWTPEQLLRQAAAGDPEILEPLLDEILVRETYFFRQGEHFDFIVSHAVPAWRASGRSVLRAWSAGCATGEEAYSLAACLLTCVHGGGEGLSRVEVLGTDVLERNLDVARKAEYDRWSQRLPDRQPYPLYHRIDASRVRIDDSVRAVTYFSTHDLRELPPALDGFDVVLCRNVLVYFTPEAVEAVCARLATSLAPGGVLLFGTMDVNAAPPGLTRIGPPELQAFQRPRLPELVPLVVPALRAVEEPPAGPPRRRTAAIAHEPRSVDPVTLHLRALVHIEHGDRRRAQKALDELGRRAPEYVPGLLERALLLIRNGLRADGMALLQEVLRRTESLPAEEVLAGPEPLPVEFYRQSAEAYLRQYGSQL